MISSKRVLLAVCLFCLLGSAFAAHITDKLVVGMYAQPKAEGTPLQLLSSGTPLEVIRRQGGFAEVRLADQTTGWVEAGYVTEDKPARAMLLETQARLRQMGMELAALRERQAAAEVEPGAQAELARGAREAQLAEALELARQRVEELERGLAGRSGEGLAAERLRELEDRVQRALQLLAGTPGLELREAEAGAQGVLGRYLLWLVALLALLLGFAAGVAFVDYRIRRRYGGFRI